MHPLWLFYLRKAIAGRPLKYYIMYDAANLRRAAGQQAELLNQLVQDLEHLLHAGYRPQTLKTLLGHTYPQVIAGFLLGAAIATISYL